MDDTGHIWTLANQSQVTAGSIWNCCISFERYLVMIFPFYMRDRNLISLWRNMVIIGVICIAVAVVSYTAALKKDICVHGMSLDSLWILDMTMISTFSIAWVLNLVFTCAAIHELKRMWIQRRNMAAGSQGHHENVEKQSAVMLLLNA